MTWRARKEVYVLLEAGGSEGREKRAGDGEAEVREL